jgi:hypothetical protein
MRGAFWCVITATTPGCSAAAPASSEAMRPFAIVLCTIQA